MSSALSRLKEIAQGNRSQWQPSLLEFPSVDADQIASDLELEKRGRERGEAGEPRTGSQPLDSIEREIVDKIQSFQQAAVEHLTGQLDVCTNRLRQLQFDSMVAETRIETKGTVTDFEQEGRNGLNTLFQVRRNLIDETGALEAFKKAHKITRPANRKPNALVTSFIVAVIFLFESFGNTGLIGDVHEGGIIGAYALAFTLSLINVLSGFAAGYFGLREAHHIERHHKLYGRAIVGVYLAFIFMFNLFIAHVRDAMQSGGLQEALNQAWPKLLSFSFDFQDYQAPIMLLIGIAFSLVAFYKGFKNDDPYPGYGHRSRERDRAEEIYADMAAGLGDDLTARRNEINRVLQNVAVELGFRRTGYFEIISTSDKLIVRHKAFEKQLGSSTQRLLNVYRDANKRSRETSEPKYFRQEFKLNESHMESSSVDEIYSKDTVESLIEEAKNLIDDSIQEIDKAHREAFRRFDLIAQTLDQSRLEEIAIAAAEKEGA